MTTAARARMGQTAAGLRPMMKGQTGVRAGRGGLKEARRQQASNSLPAWSSVRFDFPVYLGCHGICLGAPGQDLRHDIRS